MAGTVAGGKAAAASNRARHGDDYYCELGKKSAASYMSKPPSERKPRGFAAMDREKVQAAGAVGGTRSRRNKPSSTFTN